MRQAGLSTKAIGFVSGLSASAMVVSPLIFFLFSRYVGAVSATLLGLTFGCLGLAVIPLLSSVAQFALVGTIAQMITFFRIPGVLTLLRLGTSRQDRATSVAINNTAWAIACFVGGPLWGLVVRAAGLSSAFFVAGLGTGLGAAALFAWSRARYPLAESTGVS
jgi:predicted MFS family arabinose efflux permease